GFMASTSMWTSTCHSTGCSLWTTAILQVARPPRSRTWYTVVPRTIVILVQRGPELRVELLGLDYRRMKHIGIVACSAEGAALCYQTICRDALTLVGKNDHPEITLDSIPMARWLPAFDASDYRGVARFMLESARRVAAAGADFAICPDNSAHLAWEHVLAETPIPWLHIGEVVSEEADRRG